MLSLFVVLWKHRQEHNYGLVVMTQAPCKTPSMKSTEGATLDAVGFCLQGADHGQDFIWS